MVAVKYVFLLVILFSITACSKKATLYENYWETREAGAYKFTAAKVATFSSGILVSDSTIELGDSYILLYTTAIDGFYNELKLYGFWDPPFFKNLPTSKAWNMENDDKRITFSAYDAPSNSYLPTATLTMDNVGDKKQTWHYVISSGNTYIHYTISVERNSKP